MEGLKKIMAASILLPVLLFTGCRGSAEAELKEFTSADGTVSISLNEDWTDDSTEGGAGLESWIIAYNDSGTEGMMVMQLSRELYLGDVKELVKANFYIADETEIEEPDIPGLGSLEAYSCTVTVDEENSEGAVVYGETDYAYYGILYMTPELNDKKMDYFRRVCATFKESAPEVETVSVDPTILWFNATCAVLTDLNGWDYNVYGGLPFDASGQAAAQSLLSGWWEVTERESADETMDWLLGEGNRVGFAEEMAYIEETGMSQVPEEKRANHILEYFNVDDAQARSYAEWYGFYEKYGDDVIAGWDYSRAMSLLANYYLAGYYTETEALNASLELAGTIQDTFESWDDFMESYFIGYEYWSEESSDERRAIYEKLKAASDSPYNVDWNLTFEKSW